MSNFLTKQFNRIALIVLGVIFFISSLFGVSGGVYAAAETEEGDSNSAILRELGRLTIGGEKFDAANYPADEEGTPALLYLSELGYGYTADKQIAFSLNLYIFNPAQLNIVQDVRNTVQMKIGNAERYSKYALSVIDRSSDKLFYKLGVSFTAEEKKAVLAALDKNSRTYEVSSVEFFIEGFNATDYPIARTFTYKGYAAGLGGNSDSSLESTLSYFEAGGTETIPLEVNHTSWRPEGTNGNSEYTQDTIHSVYFAVSKEFDEQYDYLKSVQARWLEARLSPVFVTGDLEAYNALIDLQKRNASNFISGNDGNLMTGPDPGKKPAPEQFVFSGDGWSYDWALGTRPWAQGQTGNYMFDKSFGFYSGHTTIRDYIVYYEAAPEHKMPSIFLTAYTGGDNAMDFVLTSDELTDLVQTTAVRGYFLNDKNVAGKYPSYIFDSWNEDFTTTVITVGEYDKTLKLHSEQVWKSWWNRLWWGTTPINQQDYENIKAIQPITDNDVQGKTPQEICDNLFISKRDVKDFTDFYNDKKEKNTVYLLRFAISEYWSEQTVIFKQNKYSGVWAFDEKSRNGYLAQETCYLDFDIIDFEYVKDDKSYVIPVSMSPIDIFPELTPPPRFYDFWPYGVGMMAALIVGYIVYKIAGKSARGKG